MAEPVFTLVGVRGRKYLTAEERTRFLAAARRRAWARDTAGYGPRPRSRRRPSIVTRWIQDFEPPAA